MHDFLRKAASGGGVKRFSAETTLAGLNLR